MVRVPERFVVCANLQLGVGRPSMSVYKGGGDVVIVCPARCSRIVVPGGQLVAQHDFEIGKIHRKHHG